MRRDTLGRNKQSPAFSLGFQMLQPQPAEAVFHHIPHDPVRGEKLRCGRDVLLADFDVLFQIGKDFILWFGIVILIQPADDLDSVFPVILRNTAHHLLYGAALPQKVVGKSSSV